MTHKIPRVQYLEEISWEKTAEDAVIGWHGGAAEIQAVLTSCATCCQLERMPGSVPKHVQNEKALINMCPSNPQMWADEDVNAWAACMRACACFPKSNRNRCLTAREICNHFMPPWYRSTSWEVRTTLKRIFLLLGFDSLFLGKDALNQP